VALTPQLVIASSWQSALLSGHDYIDECQLDAIMTGRSLDVRGSMGEVIPLPSFCTAVNAAAGRALRRALTLALLAT
jgi:hypothetical protein